MSRPPVIPLGGGQKKYYYLNCGCKRGTKRYNLLVFIEGDIGYIDLYYLKWLITETEN